LTAPVPHGAFYVVHYPVAQKVALWYGDPNFGNALACGTFACPAVDGDALDMWLSGAEGLEAVRVAWGVVRDFATEALAKYEDFANPRGQLALFPAERDVYADPRPGDRVQDPTYAGRHITVRFATADRVYVDVVDVNGNLERQHPSESSPSDGTFYWRSKWSAVVSWVLL
jgi:hypothetical protein